MEENTFSKEPYKIQPLIDLALLSLNFSRISRRTYHEDGLREESDSDHTVMLGFIACSFAKEYAPHLDLGKVAQLSLVHDLVEVYAGDTMTGKIQDTSEIETKKEREHAAFLRIEKEFGKTLSWIPETIASYESLETKEARFVKTMDKVLPKITHLLNNGTVFTEEQMNRKYVTAFHKDQYEKMSQSYAKDQPEALALYRAFSEIIAESLFKDEK